MSNNVLAYDSSDLKVKIEGKNRKEKVMSPIYRTCSYMEALGYTKLSGISCDGM